MPRTGLTSEQLKEKAIDCAIAQMKQHGFNRVTFSEIAKNLGVTHAALYGHFADKSALFDAVSERWLAKLETQLQELCEQKAPDDALDRLIQWNVLLHRMKIEKVQHEPELFKAFNYSAQAEKPFVKKHMASMHHQLSTIIRQAMASGLIRKDNIDSIASLLFDATLAFHHPALVAALIVNGDREAKLRSLLQVLLAGLTP